jgi:hypothetical protein
MNVEKYAEISGLGDIILDNILEGRIVDDYVVFDTSSGPRLTVYVGAKDTHVRSNCPLLVSLSGSDLVHSDGVTTINTRYGFNYTNGSVSFNTFMPGMSKTDWLSIANPSAQFSSDTVDQDIHIEVEAATFDKAAQKAGSYSGEITVTLSAL